MKLTKKWMLMSIHSGKAVKAKTLLLTLHGGQDDSILSAKLIRIVPETSSF
jgi:hypothetical protein